MAESFVSTLKVELVSTMEFPSRQDAKTAIFEYLETFYNARRFHSALGYRNPRASRRIECKKLKSRKVNVSALAGETQ
jgi:transposase InsO family protein